MVHQSLFPRKGLLHLIVFLISIFAFNKLCIGQPSKINFTSLTTRSGLSNNTVSAILKDRSGFLWFGTQDGLCRYDGSKFYNYKNIPGDDKSLQLNEITCLAEDKNGIWVGTAGGSVSFLNNKSKLFTRYSGDQAKNGLSGTFINSICVDHRGIVWVGSYGGLDAINPFNRTIKRYKGSFLNVINFKDVFSIYEDREAQLWIGTNNGLLRFNRKTNIVTSFQNSENDHSSISNNRVKRIIEDTAGNLWAGTRHGLNLYNKDKNGFVRFYKGASQGRGITDDNIYTLAADKEGRIWAGTEEGIDVLCGHDGVLFTSKPDKRNRNSLSARSIRSICFDNEGICWVGTYQGGLTSMIRT